MAPVPDEGGNQHAIGDPVPQLVSMLIATSSVL